LPPEPPPGELARMPEHTVPERPHGRAEVVFRQLDQEWVIFDPETHRLHALNLTAALVWEHCTGEMTVPEIASLVADAFPQPVDPDAVLRDVEGSVGQFHAEGLLG
jgi:hypothetical protein